MGWPRDTSSFPEPTWWNGDAHPWEYPDSNGDSHMDEEFCVIHGYEYMRKRSIFDKFAYCVACQEAEDMEWRDREERERSE